VTRSVFSVDAALFSPAYLDKAERVFLHPDPQYPWSDIVSGVQVRSESGGIRRIAAVGQERAFHVVYFDLIWNNRYCRWGGNLFETNP
jgi:hypothetical protein